MNVEKFYATAEGSKWYGRTIKYTLEGPLYKGIIRYKDNKDNKVKDKKLILVL